ncbi:MAG: glycosyltransferase [Ignavibacteriae bacterium]|nr:glycosyltransferase [Ignavibacteriota bacterium]
MINIILISIITFAIYNYILFKLKLNEKDREDQDELKLSIVIAAKNEEKNLQPLIAALSKLNYSTNNYEVIIVDDNSEDTTLLLAKQLTQLHSNYTVVTTSVKMYCGKRGALQIGIEKAKHPYIIITDADCEPMPNWLKAFSNNFSDSYDFLFGIAPFKQSHSITNKMSTFENLRSHLLTLSFADIGLPYSATARSFGFRKKSFTMIEGYKNATDTLSGDDDLLLREAKKHNMKIGTITNSDAFVYSTTSKYFKDYLRQKARHTSTSNYYLLRNQIMLGVWHLINLAFLFSPTLMIIDPLFIVPFLVKVFADCLIIKRFMKKFTYKFSLYEIFYLQFFYEFMIIINYVNGLFSKDKW